MTREEAIKVINNHYEHWKRLIRDKICDKTDGVETINAFEMAIKALEQEPCEDAISREAVQNYVESHIQEINTGYGDLNNHTNRILRMIVDSIGNMPSIQPINHKQEEINQDLWAENETLETEVEKYKKAIKALGEDMRKCQESITDEKVLIGFNMAVALCNKHLAEKDNQDTVPFDFELYESGLMNMPKGMIEVLNKIRAEIKDVAFDWQEIDGEHNDFKVISLDDALNIIDKYKAESEVSDEDSN